MAAMAMASTVANNCTRTCKHTALIHDHVLTATFVPRDDEKLSQVEATYHCRCQQPGRNRADATDANARQATTCHNAANTVKSQLRDVVTSPSHWKHFLKLYWSRKYFQINNENAARRKVILCITHWGKNYGPLPRSTLFSRLTWLPWRLRLEWQRTAACRRCRVHAPPTQGQAPKPQRREP